MHGFSSTDSLETDRNYPPCWGCGIAHAPRGEDVHTVDVEAVQLLEDAFNPENLQRAHSKCRYMSVMHGFATDSYGQRE